ncbi:hypothetical protein B0H12DRAFT_1244258 [Mycena haematopus]|nr:hypothetical protein B0H12DRAFT_1244258 [Mycena haematopus]
MSTPQDGTTARSTESPSWRASPPHLAGGAQGISGHTMFQSAVSPGPGDMGSTGLDPVNQQNGASRSPSIPRTQSPESGLEVRVGLDENGHRVFFETATGLRLRMAADSAPLTEADITTLQFGTAAPSISQPPSEVSDIHSTSGRSNSPSEPQPNAEGLEGGLLGALNAGRDHLLTSTAISLDHHLIARDSHRALVQLRDDVDAQLTAFHHELDGVNTKIVEHVDENVKVLRELGASEDAIKSVIAKMSGAKLSTPGLTRISSLPSIRLPEAVKESIDASLAPRLGQESIHDFQRRAQLATDGKHRTASAFTFDEGAVETSTARPQQDREATARQNPKSLRFEDIGSISTGIHYRHKQGNTTLGDVHGQSVLRDEGISQTENALEEYQADNDRKIAAIIERQVGEALDVPTRVKAPKLGTPQSFSGSENDPVAFISWTESITMWMRAQFLGRPDVDAYRVTLLKTLLMGNALEWFIDHVEGQDGPSTIPYDFTIIMCALHRRFITFATAQKASKAFDLVRYHPDDGPTKLMDSLVTASRRMREPMTDFVIRQRFLSLVPHAISEFLAIHKGLTAEYSTVQQLRFHAAHFWDTNTSFQHPRAAGGNNAAAGTGIAAGTCSATPAARRAIRLEAPAVTKPTVRFPANPTSSTTATRTPGIVRAGDTLGDANKQCFKCGVVGHIGVNCSRNTNPRVGLAATRVLDSYSEDDYEQPAAEGAVEEVHDDWGGSQYEPNDEDDPADLGNLIDLNQSVEPRVGAMTIHYFSARIVPITIPVVDLSESEKRAEWLSTLTPLLRELADTGANSMVDSTEELFGPSALVDVARINESRVDRGEAEFTPEEAEERRRGLILAHLYPILSWTSFSKLAFEFQVRTDGVPQSRSVTEEWSTLLLLDAAEQARREFQGVEIPRWEVMMVSTFTLAGSDAQLIELSDRFCEHIQAVGEIRTVLFPQHTRAISLLHEVEGRPAPARARAQQVLAHVGNTVDEVIAELEQKEEDLENLTSRLQRLHTAVLGELNRREVREEIIHREQRPMMNRVLTRSPTGSRGGESPAPTVDEAAGALPGSPPPVYVSGDSEEDEADTTSDRSADEDSVTHSAPEIRVNDTPGPEDTVTNSAAPPPGYRRPLGYTTFLMDAETGTLVGSAHSVTGQHVSVIDEYTAEDVPEYPGAEGSAPTARSSTPTDSDRELWAQLPEVTIEELTVAESSIDGVVGLRSQRVGPSDNVGEIWTRPPTTARSSTLTLPANNWARRNPGLLWPYIGIPI